MTQPRQPKGVPVGGQYAPTRRDEAAGVLLDDHDDEAQWKEWFSPTDRAQLTRNGITYDGWMEPAQILADNETLYPNRLIDPARLGYDPEATAAIMRACGGKARFGTRAHWLTAEKVEAIENWPEILPVTSDTDLRDYLDSDSGVLRLASVAEHMHEGHRERPDLVRAVAESNMDSVLAERYGSKDDWYRAYLCQREGVDEQVARAWNPKYPVSIDKMTKAGWVPGDFDDLETDERAKWAEQGFTKDQYTTWAGSGFSPSPNTRRFAGMGVDPDEAREWCDALGGPGFRDTDRIDMNHVYKLREAGVTAAEAFSVRDAGVTLDWQASEVVPDLSAVEAARWAKVLGPSASTAGIAAWKLGAGITDPDRADAWMQRMKNAPVKVRNEVGQARTMRFINRHVQPPELDGDRPHPVVVATARALDIDEAKLSIAAAKDKRGAVEACRTAFRRRRKDPPF